MPSLVCLLCLKSAIDEDKLWLTPRRNRCLSILHVSSDQWAFPKQCLYFAVSNTSPSTHARRATQPQRASPRSRCRARVINGHTYHGVATPSCCLVPPRRVLRRRRSSRKSRRRWPSSSWVGWPAGRSSSSSGDNATPKATRAAPG